MEPCECMLYVDYRFILECNYRNELEQVSCTDVEQAWGKRKRPQSYGDVTAFKEFCHIKRKRLAFNQVDEDLIRNAVQELLKRMNLIYYFPDL